MEFDDSSFYICFVSALKLRGVNCIDCRNEETLNYFHRALDLFIEGDGKMIFPHSDIYKSEDRSAQLNKHLSEIWARGLLNGEIFGPRVYGLEPFPDRFARYNLEKLNSEQRELLERMAETFSGAETLTR